MTEAVAFLTSVGQAIASMRFYHEGHPARERARDDAYAHARDLLDRDHLPRFTFADREVVYHRTILHELNEWEWGTRFEAAGIGSLELQDSLTREEFSRFLYEVATRVAGETGPDSAGRPSAPTGIRFGAVELRSDTDRNPRLDVASSDTALSLGREIEAVEWMHEEVIARRELPWLEADVVVRSLALASTRERQVVLPLLRPDRFDEYATTHSCNVAVLTTTFGRHLGFDTRLSRTLGVCGLVHDIGMVRIPPDILVKPGRLERNERDTMEKHPVHGARILIERERHMDLAAIVSFEHHRRVDGTGYPRRTRTLRSHVASRIVQICDVFDALCTDRPYRAGLPPDVALAEIEAQAGTHLDPDLVRAFAELARASSIRFSTVAAERRSLVPAGTEPDRDGDRDRSGNADEPEPDPVDPGPEGSDRGA